MRYLGEDEVTQMMGIGCPGEVRRGPDGAAYQWVQGVDGLGNPIGIWKKLRKGLTTLARRVAPVAAFGPAALVPRKLRRRVLRSVLPLAQRFAPFIPVPGAAAALKVAAPILQRAGVAGYGGLGALYQAADGTLYQMQGIAEDEELRGLAEEEELRGFAEEEELRGLGALYQAPDGTLYQVQGLAEDEELRGLAEEEELRGLAEDEELRGFAEEEELRGFSEDEELRGFSEDEELRGFAEADELSGLDQGYVRQTAQAAGCCCPAMSTSPTVSGLEAYVPEQPPRTRWFQAPACAPKLFEPIW
jgi:hypothetical protein